MPDDLHHVTKVEQRGDDTIVVYIQTDSFKAGQEVEVSAYLTQADAYAAYNDKKHIPLPDPDNPELPAVLHVELPATELDATQDVTVVTRVTEVWPTVLPQDQETLNKYKGKLGEYALKAVWTYPDSEGKGSGDGESQSTGNGDNQATPPP